MWMKTLDGTQFWQTPVSSMQIGKETLKFYLGKIHALTWDTGIITQYQLIPKGQAWFMHLKMSV
jgi:hypothetical protein